jgi:hypothetical protein
MKSALPAAWQLGRAGVVFLSLTVAFIVSCRAPETFGDLPGGAGGAGGTGGEFNVDSGGTSAGTGGGVVAGSGGEIGSAGSGGGAPEGGVPDQGPANGDLSGSGGISGSGGTPGSGGATGSGGASGSGGKPGTGDGGAPDPCAGVMAWSLGALSGYAAGTKVVYGGPPHLFQCKANPAGMWCQFNTYEPLASTEFWRGAWDDLGACMVGG